MRPRPHVLVLVIGAAAVLLVSAPALGAAWLSPELPALSAAQIEHSPAIAVDPGAPTRAAVVADDGLVGAAAAHRRGLDGRLVDGLERRRRRCRTPARPPPVRPTSPGACRARRTSTRSSWARTAATSATLQSGIFFSISSNAGASYDSAPIGRSATRPSARRSSRRSPSIAASAASTSRSRRLDLGLAGCSGTPDSSQISLAYSDISAPRSGRPGRRAASPRSRRPARSLPQPRARRPARRARRRRVPQRRRGEPADRDRDVHLALARRRANYCGAPTPGIVGASTVVGDATAPALVSGLVGRADAERRRRGRARRPSPGTRAPAAPCARSPRCRRTAARRSGRRSRSTRRAPGNQVAPELAATAGGRVDVAYLWDAGAGSVARPSASAPTAARRARRPRPGRNPSSCSPSAPASATPITGQAAPLGQGLGVATSSVSHSAEPAPADRRRVHRHVGRAARTSTSSGLLHGTTAPVDRRADGARRPRTSTTIVHVTGERRRRRPAHLVGRAAATRARARAWRSRTRARGDFAFTAANVGGHRHVRGGRDRRRARPRGARADQRRRRQRPARDQLHDARRARGHAATTSRSRTA